MTCSLVCVKVSIEKVYSFERYYAKHTQWPLCCSVSIHVIFRARVFTIVYTFYDYREQCRSSTVLQVNPWYIEKRIPMSYKNHWMLKHFATYCVILKRRKIHHTYWQRSPRVCETQNTISRCWCWGNYGPLLPLMCPIICQYRLTYKSQHSLGPRDSLQRPSYCAPLTVILLEI